MTQPANKTTYIPDNGNLPIPSRDEFHRYFMNNLDILDFCTDYPPKMAYQINKVASALRRTKNIAETPKYILKGWSWPEKGKDTKNA